MKIRILIFSSILIASLQAEFRTWTRIDGKTAELELVEISGEPDVKVGGFKMKNGKVIELPASCFVAEPGEKPGAEAVGKKSVFDAVLDGQLVKLEGKSLKRHSPEKYYVFYYTASWCGPCQKYTPTLVEFYNQIKPDIDEFELLLISSDNDQDDMENYAKEKSMPWPQLKLSKVKKFEKEFNHGVKGIPSILVCDLEGKIVSRSKSFTELGKLLK